MNKQEAIKLLALIKVAYPTAYRDMDDMSKKATVNMWASSFPDVPYPIMEQAFNSYRMMNKYPPTVAEMVAELKTIHIQAMENALLQRAMDNEEGVQQCRMIMAYTSRYKDAEQLVGLNYTSLARQLSGGEGYGEIQGYPGPSGNRLDRENRLPQLGSTEEP